MAMKTVGLFEAKTHLSKLCDEVARSGKPVLISRRGAPLVQIAPVEPDSTDAQSSILDDLRRWDSKHPEDDSLDFEPPPRMDADRSPLENYWE